MKELIFEYSETYSMVFSPELHEIISRLKPEIDNVKNAIGSYDSSYASVSLPSDTHMFMAIEDLVKKKRSFSPVLIIVVGIGGSHLGAAAIAEYLRKTGIYFVDTIDPDYVADIIASIEYELQQGNDVLLNVVTKSGTTTETIANFEVFLQLLKKYRPDNYADYIVITTDKGSPLWQYAEDNHISLLEVPRHVGGRFSVFSPVGLFPLSFIGVDVKRLMLGAHQMIDCCIEYGECNIAAVSAALLYIHYKRGIRIHDSFVFYKNLFSFGKWYRQLIAESVGKKYDKNGMVVEVGIVPTISVGPDDLHSVAQLYLAGPKDRFTTFITVTPDNQLFVPDIDAFKGVVAGIQRRSFISIMDAIVKGVKIAHEKGERPFVSIHLPQVDAFCIGQLLQWKMLEIIYLGYLLHINPFNQPQVELYKKETREILLR